MWTNYSNGSRLYCGHALPNGLVKNQKLTRNLLTPTTKDDTHDELISSREIVESSRMTQAEWEVCQGYAHALFECGQAISLEKGLILVHSRYEFGLDAEGRILLVGKYSYSRCYCTNH